MEYSEIQREKPKNERKESDPEKRHELPVAIVPPSRAGTSLTCTCCAAHRCSLHEFAGQEQEASIWGMSAQEAMTEELVTTEVRGHVFLIGLNRASKLNSFNLQMLRELSAAYTRYEKDSELWCALLYAHGDNFTSGLDLSEVGPAVASGQALFPEDSIDPLDLNAPRRSKPVICAVQGWCLTIGMELLMASDIRIAAEGTTFSQMEVRRGIMPFGGATLRLPQIAGWGNAMLHLLTGDRFDAAEALRIGLVQRVVSPEQLFDAAVELATQVASAAPLAVQASLASSRAAVEEGTQEAAQSLIASARKLMATGDAKEGMQSFIERRDAKFSGS